VKLRALVAAAVLACSSAVAAAAADPQVRVGVASGVGAPLGLVAGFGRLPLLGPAYVEGGVGLRVRSDPAIDSGRLRAPTFFAALGLEHVLWEQLYGGVDVGLVLGRDVFVAVPGDPFSQVIWTVRKQLVPHARLGWSIGRAFAEIGAGVAIDLSDPNWGGLGVEAPSRTSFYASAAVGWSLGARAPVVATDDARPPHDRALLTPTALTLAPRRFRVEVIDGLAVGASWAPLDRLQVDAALAPPVVGEFGGARGTAKLRVLDLEPLHAALVAGGWSTGVAYGESALVGGGAIVTMAVPHATLSAALLYGHGYAVKEGHEEAGFGLAPYGSAIVDLAPAVALVGEVAAAGTHLFGAGGLRVRGGRWFADVAMLRGANPLFGNTFGALPWITIGATL
jgi:hypothetical protein